MIVLQCFFRFFFNLIFTILFFNNKNQKLDCKKCKIAVLKKFIVKHVYPCIYGQSNLVFRAISDL